MTLDTHSFITTYQRKCSYKVGCSTGSGVVRVTFSQGLCPGIEWVTKFSEWLERCLPRKSKKSVEERVSFILAMHL